jgi:hypothetical protein
MVISVDLPQIFKAYSKEVKIGLNCSRAQGSFSSLILYKFSYIEKKL